MTGEEQKLEQPCGKELDLEYNMHEDMHVLAEDAEEGQDYNMLEQFQSMQSFSRETSSNSNDDESLVAQHQRLLRTQSDRTDGMSGANEFGANRYIDLTENNAAN